MIDAKAMIVKGRKKDIIFYENKNNKFHIENVPPKIILPLVLILNQFRGLAVNTSLILEKDADEPYPWVCNWDNQRELYDHYLSQGKIDIGRLKL